MTFCHGPGRGSGNFTHGQTVNDNLQRGPECRSGRVPSVHVLIFDQGIRTFLISSALRCKATSFSVLTTGILVALEPVEQRSLLYKMMN